MRYNPRWPRRRSSEIGLKRSAPILTNSRFDLWAGFGLFAVSDQVVIDGGSLSSRQKECRQRCQWKLSGVGTHRSVRKENCPEWVNVYLIVQRGFLSKQYHLPNQSYCLLRRHVVANPEPEHPRYDLLLICSFGRFRSSPEDSRPRR